MNTINLPTPEQKIASLIVENLKIASQLLSANRELAFENDEKGKRASELLIANRELAYQNDEKEKRATELLIANKELAYQNGEKEKRATELSIANKKLAYENEEKGKRATELLIANKELAYQNEEKEKRAEELLMANKEFAYENEEKGKRATELLIANKELAYQNEEKGKIATELLIANKELEQLTYIASHDLQEPLRTISNYMQVFEEDYSEKLDEDAFKYIRSVNEAAKRMSVLVVGLLNYSLIARKRILSHINVKTLLKNVLADLQHMISNSKAIIDIGEMPELNVYELEFTQLFQNLITNAIKFQKEDERPEIKIRSIEVDGQWQFTVADNGIGIDSIYFERIFVIFQRLHTTNEFEGTGIGLANCKKIIDVHQGKIWIESTLGKGTTIHFTIPNLTL